MTNHGRGILIPTIMFSAGVVAFAVCAALGTSISSAEPVLHDNSATTGCVLNDTIADFIQNTISEWNSPGGVAVAFVSKRNDGEWRVETQGYGRAKVDGTPVVPDTLFAIASNSKLFTAIATGLLIDNGSLPLNWDSKLRTVIPEWGVADPIASSETTIIDAMSHRTGLPRHDLSYSFNETLTSLIRKLPHLKPSTEFRTAWQYNNIMYAALSCLPSLVLPSQPPFACYVKEHIFDRLGLNDTTYSSRAAQETDRLADAFTRQVNHTGDIFGQGTPRVYPFFMDTDEEGSFNSGAGGVISSARDMATWLQALLLEGRDPRTNESVIPVDVVRKVSSGITVSTGAAPYPELGPIVYGGGQMRGTYRGYEYIEVNISFQTLSEGSLQVYSTAAQFQVRYRTQIIRFPNERFGLAVLVNDDTYGTQMHEVIKWRIVDSYLGLHPVDWTGRAKSKLLADREKKPKSLPRPENATAPSGLGGWYDNAGYGAFLFCRVDVEDATEGKASEAQVISRDNEEQVLLQDRRPKHVAAESLEASECRRMREIAPTVLPGAIDQSVPTLLAKWNRVWSNYIKLTHYDGGIFNVSVLASVPTGNASEPYWVAEVDENPDLTTAEFAFDQAGRPLGLGLTGGLWGAGAGVPPPSGSTPQARAEVWFSRV